MSSKPCVVGRTFIQSSDREFETDRRPSNEALSSDALSGVSLLCKESPARLCAHSGHFGCREKGGSPARPRMASVTERQAESMTEHSSLCPPADVRMRLSPVEVGQCARWPAERLEKSNGRSPPSAAAEGLLMPSLLRCVGLRDGAGDRALVPTEPARIPGTAHLLGALHSVRAQVDKAQEPTRAASSSPLLLVGPFASGVRFSSTVKLASSLQGGQLCCYPRHPATEAGPYQVCSPSHRPSLWDTHISHEAPRQGQHSVW